MEPADVSCKEEIAILVGSDYYLKIVTGHVEHLTEGLTAVETIFGWVVQGTQRLFRDSLSSIASVLFLSSDDQDQYDHIDPSEMWRLDVLGITDPVPDNEDSFATTYFSSQVVKRDGRYVVLLMVKGPGLPAEASNWETAKQRLLSQLWRFRSLPQLMAEYDSVIREHFTEGHAEK